MISLLSTYFLDYCNKNVTSIKINTIKAYYQLNVMADCNHLITSIDTSIY